MTRPRFPSLPTEGEATWIAPGILYVRSTGRPEPAALNAYYDGIVGKLAATSGPYVIVSDTRSVHDLPNAVVRKIHADRSREIATRFTTRCVLSVVLSDSAPVRAAITAIYWFVRGADDAPYHVASSEDECIDRALAALG